MSEKDVIKETKPRMDTVIEDFRRKLSTVRTGRAAISLLDSVMVDYYGTITPLNQMASVHAPEPQMLTVQPWDQTQVGPIEKAIRAADLGLFGVLGELDAARERQARRIAGSECREVSVEQAVEERPRAFAARRATRAGRSAGRRSRTAAASVRATGAMERCRRRWEASGER